MGPALRCDLSHSCNSPIAMKTPFTKFLLFLTAASMLAGTSCRQKERVLDVETPAGHLKVDKDKKSGDVEIKVDDKNKK